MLFNVIILATVCCLYVEAARILTVVPTPSISHQVVFRPLTQELAKRGHEVVIITADPAFPKGQAPENLTEVDIHDISYDAWRKAIFSSLTTGKSEDSFDQFATILTVTLKIFESQFTTAEVQSVINNSSNHFDLLIIEAVSMPALVLSDIFKVPVIAMSTFGGFLNYYDVVGAPSRPPLIYPNVLRQRLFNLSLQEKISELYNHFRIENLFNTQIAEYDKVLKKMFGANTPSVDELSKNIDMLFLNVHPIWELNRPMPPNVVYMGGVHQNPTKEIPKVK